MAICWPSICCCCAPQADAERSGQPCCFVRAPASIGWSRRTGQGHLTFDEASEPATQQRRLRLLTPSLKRSVLALLKTAPRALWVVSHAVELRHGSRGAAATPARIRVSAETVRRWLHELGWEWKRAKLAAKDDDPQRVEKLARIRLAFEQLRAGAALFFADELDISLLPKVGYQWMPKGEQVEVMTPGHQREALSGGGTGSDHRDDHALCVVSQADGALPRPARDARSHIPRAALLSPHGRGR